MDKPNILHSRKFWLMIIDLVVSLATYFVTRYAAPEVAQDVLFLIGALQPVVIAVIASITVQNVAVIKAEGEAAWIKNIDNPASGADTDTPK